MTVDGFKFNWLCQSLNIEEWYGLPTVKAWPGLVAMSKLKKDQLEASPCPKS